MTTVDNRQVHKQLMHKPRSEQIVQAKYSHSNAVAVV